MAWVMARMWPSLNETVKAEPRCPEVPNETRWSRTPGSGRSEKYLVTSLGTFTSRFAGAGFPARALNGIPLFWAIFRPAAVRYTSVAMANRRDFLKALPAAAGFPTIVKASALGMGGAVAASDRVTLATIGVGWMGGDHVAEFLK